MKRLQFLVIVPLCVKKCDFCQKICAKKCKKRYQIYTFWQISEIDKKSANKHFFRLISKKVAKTCNLISKKNGIFAKLISKKMAILSERSACFRSKLKFLPLSAIFYLKLLAYFAVIGYNYNELF